MNINRRIQLISDIGEFLKNYLDENYDNNNDDKLVEFKDVITKAQSKNPWFTDVNIKVNLTYWSKKLTKHNLNKWLSKYNLNNTSRKNIAIIMAGNIPLVGFHDFICVFLSGHNSIIKLSNSDNCIIPFLTDLMKLQSERIVYSDSFLKDYDGVIATGSDNTSRYFDYYFKNKRSIIRKNRNSRKF